MDSRRDVRRGLCFPLRVPCSFDAAAGGWLTQERGVAPRPSCARKPFSTPALPPGAPVDSRGLRQDISRRTKQEFMGGTGATLPPLMLRKSGHKVKAMKKNAYLYIGIDTFFSSLLSWISAYWRRDLHEPRVRACAYLSPTCPGWKRDLGPSRLGVGGSISTSWTWTRWRSWAPGLPRQQPCPRW